MAAGFFAEAKNYLDKISKLRFADDFRLIKSFSEQIPASNLLVLIPCYAEEPGLRESLMAYSKSGIPDGCAFVVFINGADKLDDQQFGVLMDARLADVESVRVHFGTGKLVVVAHHFASRPTLSRVRGLITDAAIMSCCAAERTGLEDPVIVSNDADAISYAVDYLNNIRRAFNEDAHLDYVSGPISWSGMDEDGMARYEPAHPLPEIYFCDLLSQIADDVYREHSPVYTTGCNSAYRLSALCTIGGYDYSFDPFYDVEIGKVLNEHRRNQGNDPKRFGAFLEECLLITNPRRAIYAQLKDIAYGRQFETFGTVFGTNIDLATSIAIYRKSAAFLQLEDLLRAEQNESKIRARLIAAFLKWLEGEPIQQKKTLARLIAPKIGLELDSITGDGERIDEIKVDWTKSSLISILENWSQRISGQEPTTS